VWFTFFTHRSILEKKKCLYTSLQQSKHGKNNKKIKKLKNYNMRICLPYLLMQRNGEGRGRVEQKIESRSGVP